MTLADMHITVGAKLSGQATKFRLELFKGDNAGIAMEAVEANDPAVSCCLHQGIAVFDATQEIITKDNIEGNFVKVDSWELGVEEVHLCDI